MTIDIHYWSLCQRMKLQQLLLPWKFWLLYVVSCFGWFDGWLVAGLKLTRDLGLWKQCSGGGSFHGILTRIYVIFWEIHGKLQTARLTSESGHWARLLSSISCEAPPVAELLCAQSWKMGGGKLNPRSCLSTEPFRVFRGFLRNSLKYGLGSLKKTPTEVILPIGLGLKWDNRLYTLQSTIQSKFMVALSLNL